MTLRSLLSSLSRIFWAVAAFGLLAVAACAIGQRRLLYYPSHKPAATLLAPWIKDGLLLGYARETKAPAALWLVLHGNAGQATDRDIYLPCFPDGDGVYLLEYPGYGDRPGHPSRTSINAAAEAGFLELKRLHPGTPICVVGESIGSGPASFLGSLPQPPAKIVLVVPFDQLASVAADALPFLPARWLLLDRWNNAEALRDYRGPIEIFGARDDEVIPVKHARALAGHLPGARFHLIEGGHNEWGRGNNVRFIAP